MATSGVYDLTLQAGEIFAEAFDMLQSAADGESLTADMEKRASRSLNILISEIQSQGIHLWTYTEGTLFLQKGQFEYDFNDATTRLTNNLIRDALAADAAAPASTIEVVDGTKFTDGDKIGVVLADRSIFFTTVDGAPAGDVVTLAAPTTGAAIRGTEVYAYNDTFMPISRTLDIRRADSDTLELPMNMEPRDRYYEQPNKTDLGVPVIAYYSRQIPQGEMLIWAAPNDAGTLINFTYERKIQIVTKAADDVDFPQYWIPALTANLAKALMPKYGASQGAAQYVNAEAKRTMDQALSYDNAIYGHEIRIINSRDN